MFDVVTNVRQSLGNEITVGDPGALSPDKPLQNLVHQPPGGALLSFQLTDRTILCQANRSLDWWKLTSGYQAQLSQWDLNEDGIASTGLRAG